jgi:molybdate transport system substrate-binding protein
MLLRRGLVAMVAAAVLAVPRGGAAAEILIFAAASLADAVGEIGRGYEAAAGHRLRFNFGASSDLARQIEAGAPADVFFSADRAQMDRLQRAGLVRAGDGVEVLSNRLVVVVPAGSPRRLSRPADLASLPRIALADPEAVPAGLYARAYLQSIGLWDALRDRVVPTLNVRAALAAVESENVPAAIVYGTDALLSPRVRVDLEVPREAGPRIAYVLAPLARAGAPARDLARELASPRAAAVYGKYGFVVLTAK